MGYCTNIITKFKKEDPIKNIDRACFGFMSSKNFSNLEYVEYIIPKRYGKTQDDGFNNFIDQEFVESAINEWFDIFNVKPTFRNEVISIRGEDVSCILVKINNINTIIKNLCNAADKKIGDYGYRSFLKMSTFMRLFYETEYVRPAIAVSLLYKIKETTNLHIYDKLAIASNFEYGHGGHTMWVSSNIGSYMQLPILDKNKICSKIIKEDSVNRLILKREIGNDCDYDFYTQSFTSFPRSGEVYMRGLSIENVKKIALKAIDIVNKNNNLKLKIKK